MPDNSQKLELIRAIRQSGYPGSATEVFQAHDQGQDLVGQWVQQQQQQQEMQQQQSPQGPQEMGPGRPPTPPPPNRRPDGRVSQPNINQPIDSNQGHLVQSQSPSSVGIQNLPTGPAQGQMIQAREGGVRQSKSYVEQYRNGGGIFRTKKQKEIDALNEKILSGNLEENWDPDTFYEAGAPEDMVFGKNTIVPEITVGGNEEGKRTAMFENYMSMNKDVPYYNSLSTTEKEHLLTSWKQGTFDPKNPYTGNNPIARNIMGKATQGYGIGNNQTWMESFDKAGSAINPMRIAKEGAEYVYNNPKDAALFGADLIAGAMTVAPEPITTGLGASWLAYRGGKGLYDQHTKHKLNPEQYDPIGLNLQTLGNASYLIPGVGAGGRAATKYIPKTMQLGKETLKYGANTAHQAVKTGTQSFLKPITNMPFRNTLPTSNVSTGANIINRFGNTAVGRTFASNVNKAGTGFKNLRYGNQTINNPIAKRFFTNQNQLNVLGKGATVGTTYAPGQYINMGGKMYNRFRGGVQGSYYTLKVPAQGMSALSIGEHVSDPKNLLSLDKNLEFGTDLANTIYGGQGVADLTKGSIYVAQGDTKKAIDQGIGLFSPFKTYSRISKTYDKLK